MYIHIYIYIYILILVYLSISVDRERNRARERLRQRQRDREAERQKERIHVHSLPLKVLIFSARPLCTETPFNLLRCYPKSLHLIHFILLLSQYNYNLFWFQFLSRLYSNSPSSYRQYELRLIQKFKMVDATS